MKVTDQINFIKKKTYYDKTGTPKEHIQAQVTNHKNTNTTKHNDTINTSKSKIDKAAMTHPSNASQLVGERVNRGVGPIQPHLWIVFLGINSNTCSGLGVPVGG